ERVERIENIQPPVRGGYSIRQCAYATGSAILVEEPAQYQHVARIVDRDLDLVDAQRLRAFIVNEQVEIEPLLRAARLEVDLLGIDAEVDRPRWTVGRHRIIEAAHEHRQGKSSPYEPHSPRLSGDDPGAVSPGHPHARQYD